MKVVVGVDLGSTTTKAILLDESGAIVGKGITNSRSNYEVACAVARDEALTSARFSMLSRELEALSGAGVIEARKYEEALREGFRLELYLDELEALQERVMELLAGTVKKVLPGVKEALNDVLSQMKAAAPKLFVAGTDRKSDFFRDLAGAAFMAGAESVTSDGRSLTSRRSFEHAISQPYCARLRPGSHLPIQP
jgi:benzoyl-CoA reductase subunit A